VLTAKPKHEQDKKGSARHSFRETRSRILKKPLENAIIFDQVTAKNPAKLGKILT
jgi:hypothetical protein